MEFSVHSIKLPLPNLHDVPKPSHGRKEGSWNLGERVEEPYINDPYDRGYNKSDCDERQGR